MAAAMRSDAGPLPRGLKAYAVVLVVTAVGVGLFWGHWFVSGAYRTAGDVCYRAFENAFPVPDGVMALLMLATAAAIARRAAEAVPLGLLASGMVLYLASLDLGYDVLNAGLLQLSSGQARSPIGIIICCYAVGVWGAATLARRLQSEPGRRCGLPAAAFAAVAVGLAVILAGSITRARAAAPAWTASFERSFWLADPVAAFCAAGASVYLFRRRAQGAALGLTVCGFLLFRALIRLTFYAEHAKALDGGILAPVTLNAALLVVALGLTAAIWPRPGQAPPE